ncbi:MAG TPA: hypothetical protein VNQ50_02385 [Xanthobacteraceae bacterium]|jgi:hypothetical protein|nr:hypothetical protein [Xanthobacteraceae bacterium]
MWRDYVAFVAPALAVANGLIAIVIALLSVRRSTAKWRLAMTALALGAIAVGTTLFLKYEAYARYERQQTERSQVRERLETFILEGRTLLAQIKDMQRDLPTRPADEWAQRSEIYLRDQLGERYVTRFRKDVNDLYGDAALPTARMGYWRAVRNRVVNLETISAEFLDTTPQR